MALTASIVVDIASLSVLVLTPIAIAQKRKLSNLGGMRTLQNKLRKVRQGHSTSIAQPIMAPQPFLESTQTVNTLTTQNLSLKANVSELQSNAKE